MVRLCPADEARLDPAALSLVRADERTRIEIIRKVTPSVACVFGKSERAGAGSGVIIGADGYGLTNFHVVAHMLADRVGKAGLSDHRLYDIDVLGIDPTGDVAMFRIRFDKSFVAATLGDSDTLRVGDPTLALGNPFALAEDYAPTVTFGIVSGLHRYQSGSQRALTYTDCIQVDTSINPGNSGGPLFDLSGRLLGINGRVSIEERGRVNVGVGYAITINQIKRFIPALRAGIAAKHATAGFTVIDRVRDVIVDQILPDSEAYLGGLRAGDQIARFGGVEIHSANRFASVLGTYPGRWPLEVVYRRESEQKTIGIRLGDLPLPTLGPKAPGAKAAFDPYAPNAMTDAANREAVRRAITMYHNAVGGKAAASGARYLRATGTRTMPARPADAPTPIKLDEDCKIVTGRDADPDSTERSIRCALLGMEEKEAATKAYKVVGGDEVRGRIAVVLAHEASGDLNYRCAFDDEDGRLLRISFTDAKSGKSHRYEYGDERRTGPLKLPHARWIYVDDKPVAEDRFETITVSSLPQ